MSEKMSLTRALLEIKLIDKKIIKKISESIFIDLYMDKLKDQGTIITHLQPQKFETQATSSYQSVQDLIERRKKIKAALSKANAEKTIKIGERVYSIATAIEFKKSICLSQKLLDEMKRQYYDAHNRITTHNEKLNKQVHEMVMQNLGKETKVGSEEYNNVADPFYKANKLIVSDPLQLKTKIEILENELETFSANVDCALSEANGKEEIEI